MPSHPPTRRYPFLIANACFLRQPSVSPGLLITDVEHSVTTKRQHRWRTPLGSFTFHHIKPTWSHGYRWLKFSVCLRREKALLDGLSSPACWRPSMPSGTSPKAPGLSAASRAGRPVGQTEAAPLRRAGGSAGDGGIRNAVKDYLRELLRSALTKARINPNSS